MKQFLLGVLFAIPAFGAANAQPIDPKAIGSIGDPFYAYYGNTYSCYHPGMAECHHWWNADGTEQFFEAGWMPEGLLTLKMTDGLHDTFVANGQWCSHNAKTLIVAGTDYTRSLRDAANPVDRPPDVAILNNNRNGCSPIVDAQPGDHWYKLHLNGSLQNEREQYALMPGHQ